MSLSINAKTYTADSFGLDQVGYIGPGKTASYKDDTKLSRAFSKATSTYSGNSRTDAKLTRTLTLTGSITSKGDMIVDINVSVPVGYTAADVDTALNDFGAFLASATFKTHVKSQQINF